MGTANIALSSCCAHRRRRPSYGDARLQSAGMLEGIAKLALRSQLRSFEAIDVKVNASAARVMQGVLEGAVVRGIGWESPLGLSARLLEVRHGAATAGNAHNLRPANLQAISTADLQQMLRLFHEWLSGSGRHGRSGHSQDHADAKHPAKQRTYRSGPSAQCSGCNFREGQTGAGGQRSTLLLCR